MRRIPVKLSPEKSINMPPKKTLNDIFTMDFNTTCGERIRKFTNSDTYEEEIINIK